MTYKPSKDAQEFAKRIMSGQPTKYKPDIHIPMIKDLFREGKSIASFCVKAEISKKTFFQWIKDHPEFEEAYEDALSLAEEWWDSLAIAGAMDPAFNTKTWGVVMRNRFDYTDTRKLKMPGVDPNADVIEQSKQLMKAIVEGNYTGNESTQLMRTMESAVKIQKIVEYGEELDAIKQQAGLQGTKGT